MLTPHHNGFSKNHETIDTISKPVSSITENSMKDMKTTAVYVDFKKAFDSISHQILLKNCLLSVLVRIY